LANGYHTIEVQASSNSGTRSDVITTEVVGTVQTPKVKASSIETGGYVTTGSRKSKETKWVQASAFNQGDKVVFRVTVKDNSGAPVSGATVKLSITGPSSTEVTSAASDAAGIAEASWQTSAPNKRNIGGTETGTYTVTVTNITASGFEWDGATTTYKTFTIN
jgi:hypothetical protein